MGIKKGFGKIFIFFIIYWAVNLTSPEEFKEIEFVYASFRNLLIICALGLFLIYTSYSRNLYLIAVFLIIFVFTRKIYIVRYRKRGYGDLN